MPAPSLEAYTPVMRRTRRIRTSSPSARPGLAARRKALRLTAMLPWALLVAGCGQKGPLYHPPAPDEEDEGKDKGEDEDEETSAAPPASGPRLG